LLAWPENADVLGVHVLINLHHLWRTTNGRIIISVLFSKNVSQDFEWFPIEMKVCV
jgi:hypothetical protein